MNSSPEDIQKLIDNYEQACNSIKQNALNMSWHMRGGATYEDILNMSVQERKEIEKMIQEHLELTKKSKLPFY